MRLVRISLGFVSAVALAFGVSGQAAAANLDLNETAAAVAAPFMVSTTMASIVTVTNAGDDVDLHVNIIDGDAGSDWDSVNFTCPVTAGETVRFTFTQAPAPQVSYQCDQGNTLTDLEITEALTFQQGIMFISVEVDGQTVGDNNLFADWVALDAVGAAYSAEAIAFKSGNPGPDGNKDYKFDGLEYTEFPSALASNFLAPLSIQGLPSLATSVVVGPAAPFASGATLVLFTLDGTVGIPPPVKLNILFYDDDEVQRSTGYDFECFDKVDLLDIDPRFAAAALGADYGHLVLYPDDVDYPSIVHDSKFNGGPGNILGVRRVPVHGWLVQYAFIDAANFGAWARTLAQSNMALEPSSGDVPTLSAR